MDLASIVKIQISADESRGFPVKFSNDHDLIAQLNKDLVGLFGEIGEFSNIVKKIGIKLDRPEYEGPSLEDSSEHLREELTDSFIYLMRIAAILNTDLEKELLNKIEFNRTRYARLERP
jgi:NTP pyrophosphatase (non-canonical NTP hydrolase)